MPSPAPVPRPAMCTGTRTPEPMRPPPGGMRQLYLIELLTGSDPSFPLPPAKCAEAPLKRICCMSGIVLALTRPLVSQARLALCP